MKKVCINNINYEIVKSNVSDFDIEEISSKITDYFDDFEYIFGDYAYSKLRLKGFTDNKDKINSVDNCDEYLEKYCAYNCRYFLIKRL